MINGFWRLATTGFIWLMVASILIFGEPFQGEIVWMALILSAAAAYSTRFIWRDTTQTIVNSPEQAGKVKRTDRVSRLMDLLNDDEMADLEAWMDARRDRPATTNELAEYEHGR